MKLRLPRKLILLILPSLYLFLSAVFLCRVQHFYIMGFDFTYPYLMNGTNIACGYLRVGNIYHPGTPVEIFAGIVIFIKHLLVSNTILYQDVLLHPESYLFTCSTVLALLLSSATYFAGTYVYRHSENILLSLLFQFSPLFYNEIVRRTVLLSAESFITIISVCFMPYLYINTIGRNQSTGKEATHKNLILFGLFTALLFTTKIYCAPVAVLVLFMLKKNRQRLLYIAYTSIFSLVLLFPLYNQLRNWASLMKSMVIHTGPYGQGTLGIIKPTLYKNNIIEIFTMDPVFTLVCIFVLIAFLIGFWNILKKRMSFRDSILLITGLLVFFFFFILIIAKQYKVDCPNPLTHTVTTITKFYYFILLICSFPLAIAVSYKIVFPAIAPIKVFSLHKQKILYALFSIFAISGLRQTYTTCYEVRNQNVSFEETNSLIEKWKQTPLIIVTDGGDQVRVEPALLLGTYFSGKWNMSRYFDFLKKAYPDTYIFSIGWRDAITFWGDETNISTILQKNNKALVYLSGADAREKGITLERICSKTTGKNKINYKKIYNSNNKYESIYLIQVDTSM